MGDRHSPRFSPKLVSALEETISERRRATAERPPDEASRDALHQLLRTMRIVKAARFNAAERLERKNTVSQFALAMVSLYFVGLSIWQMVYAGAISEPTHRLVTLVSIVSSVFTLILGLLETQNGYQIKAHHLHACGLAVSDLAHELAIAMPADARTQQEYRRRYHEIVRACPVNHTSIDYAMARQSAEDGATERLRVRGLYLLNVYGLYALFLIGPPLLLLAR
jgi:hypothetical protein